MGPHHEAVRQAQVEHLQRPVEQSVGLLERDEPLHGGSLVPFGQQHVSAVIEPEVPAPLADADGRDDVGAEHGLRRELVEQPGRVLRRARAYDERQDLERRGVLRRVLGGYDLARAVDAHELALVLPDREGVPLNEVHDEGAGQASLDVRALDPGQALDAVPDAVEREAEERLAGMHADRRLHERLGRHRAPLHDDLVHHEAELATESLAPARDGVATPGAART